jgi:hypothetical protein
LLFNSKDWLQVVAPNQWQATAQNFYYHLRQKMGIKAIIPPQLTPYNYLNTNSFNDALAVLKNAHYVEQYFYNALPSYNEMFAKHGFQTYWKHTNIVQNIANLDTVYANFKPSVVRQIRKAAQCCLLKSDISLQQFYQLNSFTFKSQGLKIPYTFELLNNINQYCQTHQNGQPLYAVMPNGDIAAALYLVWDNTSAYYLAGAYNELYKQTGAMSWLHWQAMQLAAQYCNTYDFCGSSIPSIDKFAKNFGAVAHPILVVQKKPWLISLLNWLLKK